MERRVDEVFGHFCNSVSEAAQEARRNHWCPFLNAKCIKRSRLVDKPVGTCSVRFGEKRVLICPERFRQDNIVMGAIADHYFHSRDNLMVFEEISLPEVGRFDHVMVKHKPLSQEIEDFIVVEFQGGETTSTGKLIRSFKECMAGDSVEGKDYAFGLNMADIWKRTFTQVLTKGMVMESWGQKIYWVVQEPVYQDFLNRYNLHGMKDEENYGTAFAVFDLERADPPGDSYVLTNTRFESSTVDALFTAFRQKAPVSKDKLLSRLRERMRTNSARQLGFELKWK